MVLRLIKNKWTSNIVIKDHVIRYVAIRPSSPFIVREYGERVLPEGIIRDGKIIDIESLTLILEECVEDWKIKGQNVRFLVPDQYVVIRKIQIPNDIPDEEIKGYLYLELGASIHLPFEEPVLDVSLLGIAGDKKEVLLFAAPEDTVLDYSDVLEEVKLKPIAADISPLSIFRLYAVLDLANPKDHLMVIQYDLQSVNVSLFHEYKPVFMRYLTMDLHFPSWKRDKEGKYAWTGEPDDLIGQMEDIYTEIDRIMNFYRFSLQQGKAEVTRILLTGDHPKYQDIYKRLTDMTEIPVDTLDQDLIVDVDGHKLDRSFHLALGLALKEVK